MAIALVDLNEGDFVSLGERSISVREEIPFGHKIAIREIEAGEEVIKGGEVIGVATERIAVGSHVHVHNVRGLRR